jgi:hypothetical protein
MITLVRRSFFSSWRGIQTSLTLITAGRAGHIRDELPLALPLLNAFVWFVVAVGWPWLLPSPALAPAGTMRSPLKATGD